MTGIIIQARMGSTRLPGKVLMPLAGQPLLGVILRRIAHVSGSDKVVIATTQSPLDDQVETYAHACGISCFRGSEENVLERYVHCAREYGFRSVVRLTADNPFVDPFEIDRLITLYCDAQADYALATGELPIGVGAEVFSITALEKCLCKANAPHHFEHVNEYILEHRDDFHIVQLQVEKEKIAPHLRLTIDTPEDYRLASKISERFSPEMVTTEELIAFMNKGEA